MTQTTDEAAADGAEYNRAVYNSAEDSSTAYVRTARSTPTRYASRATYDAPRGALSYPRFSREGIGGVFPGSDALPGSER